MKSQVALITGSTSGIGRACVEIFQQEGWCVVGVARKQRSICESAFLGIAADLLSEAATKGACTRALRQWGHIDAVVHSVGDIFAPLPVHKITWNRWQRTMDVCLGTAVRLFRHSCEAIGKSAGAYVFIASIASQHVYPGIADYCAAKAALTAFSRSIAADLAPLRGRSNTISPAVVNTALFHKSPYTIQEAAGWHKLGRIGEPEEIAQLVEYLASEKGKWITGRDFVIDGGMLL